MGFSSPVHNNHINMKNLIIITCLFTAFNLSAQDEPRFTIGTKGGFGHSSISPNGGGFNGSWLIGLTTNYMTGEHLGFGADALYSSEGGRVMLIDGTSGNAEIDYMRVPLRVIYAMGSSSSDFRPRLAAGPTFGVNMGEGTGYKDMDFGITGSLGFNYKMLEGLWLGADAAYYHGLMDIYGGNSISEKNRNLRLELSLTFGL
jgi:hypothetical protein